MKLELRPGKYVVAVSGGVDSMVLLHILSKLAKSTKPKAVNRLSPAGSYQLVVAHFNHGIRSDSDKDEKLVIRQTRRYGLAIEVGQGNLGPKTSEERAREARYGFLRRVKMKYGADAIITAHHQDDLIETALINLLRGSGRKGLSAISDNPNVKRPLLGVPKKKLLDYAIAHKLVWREDQSNQDINYLRNYLRKTTTPALTEKKRRELVKIVDKVAKTNKSIDKHIATISRIISHDSVLNRSRFAALPSEIGNELVAGWFREFGVAQFNTHTVKKIALAIKTARPDTSHPVNKRLRLTVYRQTARFERI